MLSGGVSGVWLWHGRACVGVKCAGGRRAVRRKRGGGRDLGCPPPCPIGDAETREDSLAALGRGRRGGGSAFVSYCIHIHATAAGGAGPGSEDCCSPLFAIGCVTRRRWSGRRWRSETGERSGGHIYALARALVAVLPVKKNWGLGTGPGRRRGGGLARDTEVRTPKRTRELPNEGTGVRCVCSIFIHISW